MSWSCVDLSLLILGVLAVIYAYGKRKYAYFEGTGVKYVKPPVLFLGSGVEILFGLKHPNKFIKEIYDAFPDEKYIGLFEQVTPLLMIRDLELIKTLTIKDFDHFPDHPVTINSDIDPLFGRSLVSLSGNKWKEMRATLSPAFSSSKMKNMFVLIDDCAKQMAKYYLRQIENSPKGVIEVEAKDVFSRYTTDTIATAALGVSINSSEDRDNDFYKIGMSTISPSFTTVLKMIGYSFLPRLMKWMKITLMNATVIEFFRRLIQGAMKNREEKKTVRPDLIHLLMEARKGSLVDDSNPAERSATGYATVQESEIGKRTVKTNWSDDDLTAQAFIFFLGGFDTTSTALSFFLYEITCNLDIQRKLQEEFDDYKRVNGDKLTFNDLQHLKYLDMVTSETLRMWPPAGILNRMCSRNYTMPPPSDSTDETFEIKSNESIWIPVYAIHHDPRYYPEPHRFLPERFSDENKASINSAAYLPFGIGPRNCIGSRYALMAVKAVLFHMLLNFDFIVTPKSEIPVTLENSLFGLRPKNGIWVGMKERTK